MHVLDDDLRLDWRWIIMAPKYSGSGWHVDPANTTGWLALIAGAKLWGLYPPSEYQIPGKEKKCIIITLCIINLFIHYTYNS